MTDNEAEAYRWELLTRLRAGLRQALDLCTVGFNSAQYLRLEHLWKTGRWPESSQIEGGQTPGDLG